MTDKQEKLLQSCIVRIGEINLFTTGRINSSSNTDNESYSLATGFFLTKKHIITCAHAFKNVKYEVKVRIYFNNNAYLAIYLPQLKDEEHDVAILEIEEGNNIPEHFCVKINNQVSIDDDLYSYGYSIENQMGIPIRLKLTGVYPITNKLLGMKLSGDRIKVGNSGAPIFNKATGYVCGVLFNTEDSLYPQGGYGIFLKNIQRIEKFKEIFKQNQAFHLENNKWDLINERIQYNNILSINHFQKSSFHYLFDNINAEKIKQVFVSPNYSVLQSDGEFKKTINLNNNIFSDINEILTKQKILLIRGEYGTGKTIILKKYSIDFSNKYNGCFFLDSRVLLKFETYKDFIKEFKGINLYNTLFIFDSFENIYPAIPNVEESKIEKILQLLWEFAEKNNLKILIGSRPLHLRKNKNIILDNVFLASLDYLSNSKYTYISLKYFEDEQISEWLDNFSVINQNKHERLYIHDIKKIHKDLKKACHNPFLLYIIISAYYKKGNKNLSNLYNIYNDFINQTIKGKFSLEKPYIHYNIKSLSAYYRKFLRHIARIILENNKKIIIDRTQSDTDYYFDTNSEYYFCNYDQIKENIIEFSYYTDIELFNNFHPDNLVTNILSCYFFTNSKDRWYFRDNNILFFLIAEQYFVIIEDILSDFAENFKSNLIYRNIYRKLSTLEKISLNPMVIELILSKIDSMNDKDKATLVLIIKKLISNGYVLNITKGKLQEISAYKLNINILICLLFTHIYNESYENANIKYDIGIPDSQLVYFFKRLNWLVSAAKILNKDNHYIVRRFFKFINIYNAEFRRLNLDEYNFKQSRFKNVKFIQSKLFDVVKNNTVFDNTEYFLCHINNVKYIPVVGEIKYRHCIINKVYFQIDGYSILEFERCYIQRIEIKTTEKTTRTPVKLIFKNCNIDKLIFRNSYSNLLQIENSKYKTLSLENSKVYLDISEKSICESVTPYKIGNGTIFKKEPEI